MSDKVMIKRVATICLIVILIISVSSCNRIMDEKSDIKKFYELIDADIESTTSCLFFTDPHLNDNNEMFQRHMGYVESLYNKLPLEFCLSGGDWLNSGDINLQAIEKLKFIRDEAYARFGNSIYHILGNHDTNYQGRLDEISPPNSGLLSHATIVDLMFSRQRESYYSFTCNNARFYIFDTGIDWYPQIDNFKREQLHWFAKELLLNDDDNIVLAMHIFTNDLKTPVDFSKHIMLISEAYNNRTTVSINKMIYDFSEAKGCVSCVLCGHCHADFINLDYSIPVVGTTQLKQGDISTFDLCVFNWNDRVLNLIRIGAGSDRVVHMPS